ncbi:hypothetical protein C8F04DRAFT_951450 [Mycena alexandri]|uniref:Uncharacterized protein n=1 Tax=Mycena alexandri TaxID=1745969 RepID=A0AAD6X421_9AGAR|nr:hypothetical protein C8F04DRAFT_951450 [Mycena alexandri]
MVADSTGTWDESDIFRGDPPPPPPRSPTPSHESTTSSSSSGSYFGGRLGALAAVVELAISRWAGNEASSSSSSSSSSSDSVPHSRAARRSHRQHDDIATRISRMQAREESRQIPRQFALYLPPSLTASPENTDAHSSRITQTTSLSSILGKLENALKKSTKAMRQQERERLPRPDLDPPRPRHLHFMLPDDVKAPSRAASFTDLASRAEIHRKGKHREGQAVHPSADKPLSMPKAWFLDVSSPTWDDMRAIGKLLHLHPLTLEDILMQDPLEKLERFPKLGYYFISFRAIESWDHREKYWDRERDQGLVGEANVYLVVFNEGICTFHFTDIADHTDRVRNRIMLLEKVVNMSSGWIAHGILDSIVDSFFPFLQGLEREVMAIEDIVFSGASSTPVDSDHADLTDESGSESKDLQKTSSESWPVQLSEKNVTRLNQTRTHFTLSWPPFLEKCKVEIIKRWQTVSPATASRSPTASTLHRMARARRLMTSLSRLLATKSEVVAQLRKRLLTTSNDTGDAERAEVAIHLGDVQDHILTLENSLSHYERMLSQSHPLYISHIRSTVAISKGGSDKALMYLSAVSIGVLCIQTLIGLFSINANIPHNDLGGNEFKVFGVVISLAIVILVSYLYLVLHWWRSAKRRRSTMAL